MTKKTPTPAPVPPPQDSPEWWLESATNLLGEQPMSVPRLAVLLGFAYCQGLSRGGTLEMKEALLEEDKVRSALMRMVQGKG